MSEPDIVVSHEKRGVWGGASYTQDLTVWDNQHWNKKQLEKNVYRIRGFINVFTGRQQFLNYNFSRDCQIRPAKSCSQPVNETPADISTIYRKDFRVTANARVCSNHFVHGKPMEEHPHPELWLRGYGTDKETHNHNVSRIIESWNEVDEQSDVFITTRTGAIKRKATDSQTSSTKSKFNSSKWDYGTPTLGGWKSEWS